MHMTDAEPTTRKWTRAEYYQMGELGFFQDERVESGKTYYYYLTAVDQAGNVSPPSEVASEKVP